MYSRYLCISVLIQIFLHALELVRHNPIHYTNSQFPLHRWNILKMYIFIHPLFAVLSYFRYVISHIRCFVRLMFIKFAKFLDSMCLLLIHTASAQFRTNRYSDSYGAANIKFLFLFFFFESFWTNNKFNFSLHTFRHRCIG